jgi:hypothetical protein
MKRKKKYEKLFEMTGNFCSVFCSINATCHRRKNFLLDLRKKHIYDVFHLKRDIYLKILDRPSRISTKLFLNFIRLFLTTL